MEYPGDIQIDKYFKHFKRFLKDNESYHKIMSYLFFGKRTKKEFYGQIRNMYEEFDRDFSYILRTIPVLGDGYREFGFRHWEDNIQNLSDKWQARFKKLKVEEYFNKAEKQ